MNDAIFHFIPSSIKQCITHKQNHTSVLIAENCGYILELLIPNNRFQLLFLVPAKLECSHQLVFVLLAKANGWVTIGFGAAGTGGGFVRFGASVDFAG